MKTIKAKYHLKNKEGDFLEEREFLTKVNDDFFEEETRESFSYLESLITSYEKNFSLENIENVIIEVKGFREV